MCVWGGGGGERKDICEDVDEEERQGWEIEKDKKKKRGRSRRRKKEGGEGGGDEGVEEKKRDTIRLKRFLLMEAKEGSCENNNKVPAWVCHKDQWYGIFDKPLDFSFFMSRSSFHLILFRFYVILYLMRF